MVNFNPNLDQALESAVQHHQAGRLAEAEALYRQILQQNPGHAEVMRLWGVLAVQVNRRDVATALFRQAIAVNPNSFEALSNLGSVLRDQGQLDQAIAVLRRAIALNPKFADAHSNLGNALKDQGQLDEAIAAHRQAIALEPNLAEAYYNLGVAVSAKGRPDEAITAFRQAAILNPNFADAHYNLGATLRDQGRFDEAIAAFRQAITVKPNSPEAHYNLGVVLRDLGRLDEAIAAFRQAITVKPDYFEAFCNLGVALREQGRLDEAIAAFRQAISLKPDGVEARLNFGMALGDKGCHDEGIAVVREALALHPDRPAGHSNLLYALHLHPGYEAEAIAEEHRRWARRHAEPLKKFLQPHDNDHDPERRLRIGYVSPDFRGHAVAPMVLPLVASHDPVRFEVFCYGQVARPDAMTARFRSLSHHWRSTVEWTDEQMAGEIRRDRIDILIDLAGHTAGNRLLVFARKPAPVQVARQGYPDTTGLETIDYRMTDAYADPPGLSDTLHTEKLIRLPRTNWIYQPPEEAVAMAVTPLVPDAPITFGCFNNFAKVTEPMLYRWAEILAAVPGSRILLKAMSLASESVRERVRTIFAARGISAERLELSGWRSTVREHLQLYNRMTIGLDPFPYHGTTTTCEALWMGVPVVTLAGRTHVSRVGVSLLSNVGLPELIAQNPEDYVRLAAGLAADRPRLLALRGTLRQRMAASPLLDHVRFARDIEEAYRQMWRTWCARAG